MAERRAILFEVSERSEAFDRLLEDLEVEGVDLKHPLDRKVYLLDCQGDQVEATCQEVLERVRLGVDTSFQLWWGRNHDLYCRVRRIGSIRVIDLGMEGTSDAERSRILDFLKNHAQSRSVSDAVLGMVFDPQGRSEDYNWDRFFAGDDVLSADQHALLWPELVAVSKKLRYKTLGFRYRPFSRYLVALELD